MPIYITEKENIGGIMAINVNNITDSYNAWKNYYYGDNTQKIKQEEIAAIEEKWSSELGKWKIRASSTDENEYEISDEDYKDAKSDGKEQAENETGVKADSWKGNVVGTGATAAASVAGGVCATKVVLQGAGNGVVPESVVAKQGASTAAESGKQGVKTSAYVAAGIAIANAALYLIRKPNKEEVEACEELRDNILPETQANLQNADSEMTNASEEVAEMTEEANDQNEETNEEIADQKAQFDMFRTSLLALQAKIKSGEPLTASEQALYNELAPVLEEIGVNINELSEDNTDAVNEIYDEIEDKQEIFDMAAEVVAESEGITDYAQELDRATRTTCTVEMISQGLNSATGLTAGARLITTAGLNIAQYALGAAAIAAGVGSGLAVAEQRKYLSDVNSEVEVRKTTQEIGDGVSESYDEQIDIYDDNIEIVEDLEMEIPKDLEVPTEVAVPEENANQNGGVIQTSQNSDSSNTSEDDKKKKTDTTM